MTPCPCGSKLTFDQCCQPYLTQAALPATPEALMRSRFTAFALKDLNYITQTMKGAALKEFKNQGSDLGTTEWVRLEVLEAPLPLGRQGFVEFKAYYSIDGKIDFMQEKSRFLKIEDKWYYVDGVHSK